MGWVGGADGKAETKRTFSRSFVPRGTVDRRVVSGGSMLKEGVFQGEEVLGSHEDGASEEGVELCIPKGCVHLLTVGTRECDLIWK